MPQNHVTGNSPLFCNRCGESGERLESTGDMPRGWHRFMEMSNVLGASNVVASLYLCPKCSPEFVEFMEKKPL